MPYKGERRADSEDEVNIVFIDDLEFKSLSILWLI